MTHCAPSLPLANVQPSISFASRNIPTEEMSFGDYSNVVLCQPILSVTHSCTSTLSQSCLLLPLQWAAVVAVAVALLSFPALPSSPSTSIHFVALIVSRVPIVPASSVRFVRPGVRMHHWLMARSVTSSRVERWMD